MDELNVRIVHLEPLRFISFHGYGPNPEELAAQKLVAWAGPRGYLADRQAHRIFGFNNPDPTPDSQNYGYEFWLVVGAEAPSINEAPVQEFGGGLNGVTRCLGGENIGVTWQKLGKWLADSPYSYAHRQWLEEHLNAQFPAAPEELLLDLYAPIAE